MAKAKTRAREKRMTAKDVAVQLAEYQQSHEDSHAKIHKQLNFILHEVQANGRKGLQASLEDIYKAQAEHTKKLEHVSSKVDDMRQMLEPEARRFRMLGAMREWAAGSALARLLRSKLVRTLLYVLLVLALSEVAEHLLGFDIRVLLKLFGGS